MNDEMVDIDPIVDKIIRIHNDVLKKSGGLAGVKEMGLLRSCLDHAFNSDYYPDFSEKVGHIVFSIVKNHVFFDGNKRTALTVGAILISSLTKDRSHGDVFFKKGEDLLVKLASGEKSERDLVDYIQDLFSVAIELKARTIDQDR